MSILETVLIFAGIPVGVAVVIAGLVYAGSSARRGKRYRPGRPFEFRPVWFLSAPETLGQARSALPAGTSGRGTPVELSAADERVGDGRTGRSPGEVPEWPAPGPAGANGGASDRW